MRGLRSSRPCWNCMTWSFITRKQDLIITDWRRWWKEVLSKIYEKRILGPETDIMKETLWLRIRDKTAWRKKKLETVGNGKPTGSVLKETIAVSVTMLVNVQKWHSQIRLRILSCSRKKEKRREPEVPENVSMDMQGLPQRNLHQFILSKVAPSRMLVLQDQERLQIWGKVLICTSSGWWTT